MTCILQDRFGVFLTLASCNPRHTSEEHLNFNLALQALGLEGTSTILLYGDQLLELKDAELPRGLEYRLPFNATILQLTRPVAESVQFQEGFENVIFNKTGWEG